MTASMTWLETYSSANLALSLVIEGTPVTFATSLDMSGVFSGDVAPYSDFDDPIGGLVAAGVLEGGIDLYTPDVDANELSFKLVDFSGVLRGTILREGNTSGTRTYLTTSLAPGGVAADVKDTTGFAASGLIYIGTECIGYASKAGTSFNTLTRGKYTLNQTNGGVGFGPAHTIGNNVTASATTAPAVTDYPRTWYGRFVHLLLHVRDPLTGTFNAASEARRLWTGKVENYDDNGDGSVTVSARSVMALLNTAVGTQQWRAKLNEGLAITSTMDSVRVTNTQGAGYLESADLGYANTRKSHDEVADDINAQFRAWNVAALTSAGDMWSLELTEPDDGSPPTYVLHLRANSTAITGSNAASLRLHKSVWRLLGFATNGTVGYQVRFLQKDTVNHHLITAELPPIIYEHENIGYYVDLDLTDEVNTFVTQSYLDIDAGLPEVNGVVEIRGGGYSGLYAVKYTTGNVKTRGVLDPATNKWRRTPADSNVSQNGPVRLGDATDPPEVRQVTYQIGSAGQLLLKLALSTGTPTYNHATYDSHATAGFSASIPASVVDIDSWEELDDVKLQLLITDSRPFYKYLEQVLAASNRYVVWRSSGPETQPKLTIVRPSLETTYQASWILDESNKAGALKGPDRCKVQRVSDGIVNSVVLKYGNDLRDPEKGLHTVRVDQIASQSDYGRKRAVTIEAPSVLNADDLIATTIEPALAYFARPLAMVDRSYNASCMRMAPGDTVTLTDNYVTNPATGERGGSIYCWVLNTSFDLATGQGQCRLIFLPEKNVNYTGIWAPSARVDETHTTGGYTAGYDAATKTLYCKYGDFTDGASVGDASRFRAGDKVHIYALDEAAPLEWFDTVLSSGGSFEIALTTGLVGFDTAKKYVIEYDDASAALNTAQRNAAFLADATTLSTGYATEPTPYEWGQRGVTANAGATIDYTQGVCRPNTTYDDQGEPLSIHKQTYAIKSANNLLAYKTRNVILSEYFSSEPVTTSTTGELLFMALVPIYGHSTDGVRDLLFKLRARVAGGTGTYTVASSANRPVGASWTSFSFPGGSNTVSAAVTSLTDLWTAEITLAPVPAAFHRHGQLFTWISVYASNSLGSSTYMGQIIGSEAALT